ncbi:MAG: hypothetical protein NC328_04245 [Muribaculum sp.]|nr:hypothetical protein [Muribaculum sp.]
MKEPNKYKTEEVRSKKLENLIKSEPSAIIKYGTTILLIVAVITIAAIYVWHHPVGI